MSRTQGRRNVQRQVIPTAHSIEVLEPRFLLAATPLTNWLAWGPSDGIAGMSILHYNNEGVLTPQVGDVDWGPGTADTAAQGSSGAARGMIEWTTATANSSGYLNIKTLPLVSASSASLTYSGGAVHLLSYLKVPGAVGTTRTVYLNYDTNNSIATTVWLNGQALYTGTTGAGKTVALTLKQGQANVLMIKTPSDVGYGTGHSYNNPWEITATISSDSGGLNPVSDLTYENYDHNRKPVITTDAAAQALRYVSQWRRTDGDYAIMQSGSNLSFSYKLRVALGKASNYQDATVRAHTFQKGDMWVYTVDPLALDGGFRPWQYDTVAAASYQTKAAPQVRFQIYDPYGTLAATSTHSLSYSAVTGEYVATKTLTQSGLGLPATLTPGVYSIRAALLNSDGTIQMWDADHSFAVIEWTSPTTAQDGTPRELSAVGHHLYQFGGNATAQELAAADAKLRWLSRVGIFSQEKLSEDWRDWGVVHDGNGNISVNAAGTTADHALSLAASLGIDVVGDLGEGYPYNDSTLGVAAITLINEYIQGYPTVGAEFDNATYNYGRQMELAYGNRVDSWTGFNEIDGKVTNATRAGMYTRAAQRIAAGVHSADANAIYTSSSLIGNSNTATLFDAGFLQHPDVIDVHAHPTAPPNWYYTGSIGDGGNVGLARVRPEYAEMGLLYKPTVYGEVSAPRHYSVEGAKGHANAMLLQLLWSVSTPDVERLSYLVPYDDNAAYNSFGMGWNNFYGDPLPIVATANVAAHYIDGREQLPDLSIPGLDGSLQYLRQTRLMGDDGLETLVLWNVNTAPANVSIPVSSSTLTVMDIYGKPTTVTPSGGTYTVSVAPFAQPIILRGRFGAYKTNVALGRPVTVDSRQDSTYDGARAVDGSNSSAGSRWISDSTGPHSIEIDLGATKSVDQIRVWTGAGTYALNKLSDYTIQGWNGSAWVTLASNASNTQGVIDVSFSATNISKVKLTTNTATAYVYEIEVFGQDVSPPVVGTLVWDGGGADASWTTAANWTIDKAPASNVATYIRFGNNPARLSATVNTNNPWYVDGIQLDNQIGTNPTFVLSGNTLAIDDGSSQSGRQIVVQSNDILQINNNINLLRSNSTFSVAYGGQLHLGGAVTSSGTLNFASSSLANDTYRILSGGSVSAANLTFVNTSTSYDQTLQLDHAAALANTLTLTLTDSASKVSKVNLNFSSGSEEVVNALVINGVSKPAGVYNATTDPIHFSGTGNLRVLSSGLMAAGLAAADAEAPALTMRRLIPVIHRAQAFWKRAGADSHAFDSVRFQISDLPGNMLGLFSPNLITIDLDAAGFGWNLKTGGMDLLTVVVHELGHVLGLSHDSEESSVMNETVAPGERLLPVTERRVRPRVS